MRLTIQSTLGASRLSRILISAHHIVLNTPHYEFDHARARDAPSRIDPSRDRASVVATPQTHEIMSDSEHEVETFESADAGASHTVPMQAGSVRKGGFMVRLHRSGRARAMRRRARVWFRDERDARDARGDAIEREKTMGTFLCVRATSRSRAGRGRGRADAVARAAADARGNPGAIGSGAEERLTIGSRFRSIFAGHQGSPDQGDRSHDVQDR